MLLICTNTSGPCLIGVAVIRYAPRTTQGSGRRPASRGEPVADGEAYVANGQRYRCSVQTPWATVLAREA